MSFWNTIIVWLNGPVGGTDSETGLPLIDGCGGLDVEGNPFGADLHQLDDSWSTSSTAFSDDSWMSTSGSWDDSFSND